ncbi:hypothetical protein HELRODRAFT_191756 [Helobdella robusta]|uniref:Activin types I and II receptor domain-containing protein n=1 Tax=Helobdella robusta TaxID=6412 RepID=T1FTA0_HELRO|nr:hypothetical protein HELRODRAFT_191756 [Helobdella robusta]ESO04276.1 hypothetical protein HELRODRAFT_191756 [Helobdella robusta]
MNILDHSAAAQQSLHVSSAAIQLDCYECFSSSSIQCIVPGGTNGRCKGAYCIKTKYFTENGEYRADRWCLTDSSFFSNFPLCNHQERLSDVPYSCLCYTDFCNGDLL